MKFVILSTVACLLCIQLSAQSRLARVAKDASSKKETVKSDEPAEKSSYSKLIPESAQTVRGLMTIHHVKNNYYLEIPRRLLGHPMLMAGRVSETSDNRDVIAGQMPRDPQLVEWSSDTERVYLHNALQKAVCDSSESIYRGFLLNNLKPVIASFPIKAENGDSTLVIDVSKFFCSDEPHLSPFIPATPFDGLFGVKRTKGTYKADLSNVLEVKAFPKNITVKSRLSYTVDGEPFSAIVTFSMIQLEDTPMRPRLSDSRLGFFTDRKVRYSENTDRSEKIAYINRWRIEPRAEDLERWKQGELVEPAKPIVWYIDDAFPEKWRKWLREGIEDWQMAFEKIGFKNAIIARDYPKNDPNFDPDDIRYSCLRYASIQTANAMGPSWTDPRSGEILQGSVYFYHDVLKLLHNWRFVQTAAIDSSARRETFDMTVMGPLLRYLIVHEVGHTLGLMHNMRGSYAYPVDSLRSPSFTERFGTTASIMDYARYNYVAQPGDGVTQLLPPRLGLYDYYIIRWGYMPIPEASTPEAELPTLNRWIREKQGDPIYQYGQQEILSTIDPASQSESLGDDAVKAGRYGIANLKRITENLVKWTAIEGKDYSYTEEMYNEIFRQFNRYINHAEGYLGGNFLNINTGGDNLKGFTAVSRTKQREALTFVIESLREFPNWILRDEITSLLEPGNNKIYDYIANEIRLLTSGTTFAKVGYTAKGAPRNDQYTPEAYLNDLYTHVWEKCKAPLTRTDRIMQYAYLHSIVGTLDLYQDSAPATKKSFVEENPLPCALLEAAYASERVLTASTKESDLKIIGREIYYRNMIKLRALLTARAAQGGPDANHYAYLLYELKKAIN